MRSNIRFETSVPYAWICTQSMRESVQRSIGVSGIVALTVTRCPCGSTLFKVPRHFARPMDGVVGPGVVREIDFVHQFQDISSAGRSAPARGRVRQQFF